MANGIGNLGNIVSDFKESVNQIFGGSKHGASDKGEAPKKNDVAIKLFSIDAGGSVDFQPKRWTGNAITPKSVRYGFAIVSGAEIEGTSLTSGEFEDAYYLDIAPQSITQKENFATNISATRKGVIVESEGVVFKDIIISGTTGVFPGLRGGANNPTPNFSDFTKPPAPPAGVDPDTGRSKASTSTTLSGYEEFMRLRQFFLRYAAEKVQSDGNRFFVFINEKDGLALIVEPLEFTMERNVNSKLAYNYRIVLKAIGNFNQVFIKKAAGGDLSFLEKIGNIAANTAATIQAGRAVINQSTQLITNVTAAIDQTFIGPLRQVQFAMEDLRDGVTTMLSLPDILYRNATSAILSIRENRDAINSSINDRFNRSSSVTGTSLNTDQTIIKPPIASNDEFIRSREILDQIETGVRQPLTREFIVTLKDNLQDLADNLADFVNLGDVGYNLINERTVTSPPGPLKLPTDDEILLLGSIQSIIGALNQSLATNNMFQADIETVVDKAVSVFKNVVSMQSPTKVKEVTIQTGDSLERIALRELGEATRWVELVILNQLKAPYISDQLGPISSGIKKPGDKILVGVG